MDEWLRKCRSLSCTKISNRNGDYCTEHDREMTDKAIDLFGRKQWEEAIAKGENPITILKSNVSHGVVNNKCERCDRKFRWFRKKQHGYNKHTKEFIEVCLECLTDDDVV